MPLVETDEMLGLTSRQVSEDFSHQDLVSVEGEDNNYQERAFNAFDNIITRLVGKPDIPPNTWQAEFRKLFLNAYPSKPIQNLSIVDVGNALSAYIRMAFALAPAPWDSYVIGTKEALSGNQKKGAILFYGKGRCGVCHSGPQFSDFRYHGLAIPQGRVGKHGFHVDYGRAAATNRPQDRYTFRTTPLRNSIVTGPWGHNGAFDSLREVIEHHGNPIPALYIAQTEDQTEGAYAGRLLGHRSPILAEIGPLSPQDISDLTEFLEALSSTVNLPDQQAIPLSVPSNINDFTKP